RCRAFVAVFSRTGPATAAVCPLFPTRRSSDLVCGAAMQGLFKNPLASPDIIGVSSGGALGAVVGIVVGGAMVHPWLVPAAAFAGDRKSTRLNSSHVKISYAVFCLKKKRTHNGA